MNQQTNVNLIPKYPFTGNLYFSQYDVGRVATINLVEDGSAYTIPSGATVKIQATKPSGLGFSVDCSYSGNVVTVVSTETMTNEYGRFPCELRIESGDVLLGTTNFTFNVEKSPHPTNTVDGDSEDIINQITVALNNALSDIEDAKEEAIEEISQSGGGITEAVKVALLNCFSHVAWIDENGQTYYDALEDALYDVPAPTLTSISAVYTQSGTVYDTDTLDSLKSDLVVTAHYSDSSTSTVASTDYTLSGTLTQGTSTIIVTYQGQTDTFNVTVTHADSSLYNWDFTQSLTDSKQGVTITLPASGATQSSSGLAITGSLSSPIQCATIDVRTTPQLTIEWDVTNFAWSGGSGNKCLGYVARAVSQLQGVLYNGSVPIWTLRYTGGTYHDFSAFSDTTMFNGKTCKLQIDYSISNTWKLYCDDTLMASQTVATYNSTLIIGFRGEGTFTGLRIYEGLV